MRWSACSLASAWVCAWDHIHSNTRHHKRPRALRYDSASTCGCGNVFVDSLGAITFDPADLHGYTATCLFGGQEVG